MRTAMTWFVAGAAMVAMTGALGCASELDDEASVAEETSELLLPPPRLTLYSEGGFWGRSLVVEIPDSINEAARAITKAQLDAVGLGNQVSSVRLRCGGRAAEVHLFKAINTSTAISNWDSSATSHRIYCNPGQTVSVNLHTAASSYADRVASAYYVTHALDVHEELGYALFDVLIPNWNAALREAGADASGAPIVRMLTPTRFNIRQSLTVDHPLCSERGAVFELTALMQDGNLTITVADSYVEYGFGDAWGCRDGMMTKLYAAAQTAGASLEASLEPTLAILAPGPRDYFVPRSSFRNFWLYSGPALPEKTL